MTAEGATTRTWLGLTGVTAGILAGRSAPLWSWALIAALGGVAVGVRRKPLLALTGLFLVACGLSALNPLRGHQVSLPKLGGATSSRYRASIAMALDETDPRAAALLGGLTIGDTSGIDAETDEAFRASGLSHLVAVSGSNVAIVLGAVFALLGPLPRVVRTLAAGTALWLFVMVVGPEPSVLRAALMGAVGLVAYLTGRTRAPLNVLAIALTVLLVVAPDLLFSIGLQLSAAATLGIVLWSSRIDARLGLLPLVIRAPLAITASAQLAVAPLLITSFGQASLVSPIANLVAAPAVAPATIMGLAAGLVRFASERGGAVLAAAASPFARWILGVAAYSSSPSWASVDLPPALGLALAVPTAIAAVVTARNRA